MVTLAWNPSPTPDISYYRLYVGIQSLQAGNSPVATYDTDQLQQQVDGLELGTRYFFVVTAWKLGLESSYSDEITYTPALPTPTPEPTPGKWWKKGPDEL